MVHAVFHDAGKRFSELFLIHVMLVLTDADRLRIDLHKLGQRILHSSCDRRRASLLHRIIRQFLRCQLARRIDRSAGFAGNDILHLLRDLL